MPSMLERQTHPDLVGLRHNDQCYTAFKRYKPVQDAFDALQEQYQQIKVQFLNKLSELKGTREEWNKAREDCPLCKKKLQLREEGEI